MARSEGKVYALRDVCSHAEIPLSDGEIEDGAVECWLHGSRFELARGRPLGLPANQPVPTYPVKLEGDTDPDQPEVSLNFSLSTHGHGLERYA